MVKTYILPLGGTCALNSQDVILGMLMKRSLSGYEIKQYFETRFSYFFDASYGTIYPMLNKMERDGLLSKEVVIQSGRPNKNIYTITELGRTKFGTYIDSAVDADVYKSDFLTRMFFGEFAATDQIAGWIRSEIELTEHLLHSLNAQLEHYLPVLSPSQTICMQIGVNTYKARIETLKHGLTAFQKEEMD